MAEIEFSHVEKVFPDGTEAITDLSLKVSDGEFFVLLGPSGCGKSTLLRLLAGLETVSSGEIRIDGRAVNELAPQQRNVAMIFQNYALYPHMTVRENLEFPLRMSKAPREKTAERVKEAARLLELSELLDRRPRELSGGQAQRVAMGRAIVREPVAFLMDEPLSNLDAKLRSQIRAEIAALQRRMGTTTLYVTHDQVEAMTLGQRVAVLRTGEVQQVAPPQDLYEHPANTFVAGFLGSPPMNVFQAELHEEEGVWFLELDRSRIQLPEPPPKASSSEKPELAGLRPEAFLWPEEHPDLPRLQVEVSSVESLGHEQIVYFRSPTPVVDQDRSLKPAAEGSIMAARLTTDRVLRAQQTIELALDVEALHWFDAEGRALHAPSEQRS